MRKINIYFLRVNGNFLNHNSLVIMNDLPRKSILNIKNLDLGDNILRQKSSIKILSPSLPPRTSILLTSSTPDKHPARSSIQLKMNRLNEMKLTSLFNRDSGTLNSLRSVPKPNICISELWGAKEVYLKKTGYLKAYNELKKQHHLEGLNKNSKAKRIQKPYMTDLVTKTKAFLAASDAHTQRNQLSTIFEVKENTNTKKKHPEIDTIISQCVELSSNNRKLKQQTYRMKKIVDGFNIKKKDIGQSLKGLSIATSKELLSSFKD